MEYECNKCIYTTTRKYNLDRHKKTCRSTKFFCESCNYDTLNRSNYNRHITTQKHKIKVIETKTETTATIKINKNNKIDKMDSINTVIPNTNINIIIPKQQIKTLIKESINESNLVKNTTSIMKYLMTHYRNNPPLETFTHDKCKEALKLTYKIKETQTKNYDLEKHILNDYEHNLFINNITATILKSVKKNDPTQQSIYNTDTTRLNYIIKSTLDLWIEDKSGLSLTRLVIKPILETIKSLILDYQEYITNEVTKLKNKINIIKSKQDKKKYKYNNYSDDDTDSSDESDLDMSEHDELTELDELDELDNIDEDKLENIKNDLEDKMDKLHQDELKIFKIICEFQNNVFVKQIKKELSPHLRLIKNKQNELLN